MSTTTSASLYPPATPVAVGVPLASASATGVPPLAQANCVTATTPRSIDAATAASALHAAHPEMPRGLCTKLAEAVGAFPLRVMIVDNSGSMASGDGQRLVKTADGKSMRKLSASRWQELGDDVLEVAKMSVALQARTDFHLLNPRGGFGALTVGPAWDGGVPPIGRKADVNDVLQAMRSSPCGTTPLTEAVMQLVSMIEPYAARLRACGEQVCVIIATDGLPDNRNTFVTAMQHLQRLPVWVVVRLCTDDDDIVEFWNELDANLEAPLEVLDDVHAEAKEVHTNNRWLTYGPPLHSARLFGLPGKLFDDLDEKALLPSQLRHFVHDLLLEPELWASELPEPEVDLPGFLRVVREALSIVPDVYDPRSGRKRPWVDVDALERHIKRSGKRDDIGCSLM